MSAEALSVSSRARSCKNCATSKAKCYGFFESKCERCRRLNKACAMQTVTRKPKSARITRTAQIAQLEQKLDGLVNILTNPSNLANGHDEVSMDAAQSLAGLSQPSGSGATPNDHPSYPDTGMGFVGEPAGVGSDPVHSGAPVHPPPTLTACPFSEVFMQPLVLANTSLPRPAANKQTPDELLNIFRKSLARQVPFIIISDETTALELEEERPFLYQSLIMAASCNDASHQIALGTEILKTLADTLLVRGEKTLDVLHGLLVFLSWYQYNFHINMQLNNLLSLMNALVVDLGLQKSTVGGGRLEVFVDEMKRTFRRGIGAPKTGFERSGPRTMDERRALLGCFYISTTVTAMMPSSYVDAIRGTPFIEECCHVIETDGGKPNDRYLVQLVRLQLLSEKIRLSGIWDIALSPEHASSRAPLSLYINTFQTELHNFFSTTPLDLLEDRSLLLHYHITSMQLYEVGFFMPPTTSTLYPHGTRLKRADVLHCLLGATKAFLDEFLAIHPQQYFSFNLIHCGQMMYALGDLVKLSLFKADDWDRRMVRATIDVSIVEEQLILRMEDAASIFESNEENGLWSISARRLRKVRKNALERRREANAETMVVPDLDPTFFMEGFDALEDSFWQGLSSEAWQFVV